jgi:hypothetical protein
MATATGAAKQRYIDKIIIITALVNLSHLAFFPGRQ